MRNKADDLKRLFPIGQISIALSSILQAGSTVRKKTGRDLEDRITRRLYARLIKIPVFRDGPLDARMQPEIPNLDQDSDYAAGKIDILIACGKGTEVYFAIEAKRLRVLYPNGKLASGSNEYVMKGMMRFVTGQYAPFMQTGAMLGYVFDGKIGYARSSVDRVVQNKALELKLKSPKQLTTSKILPDAPVDETHHDLKTRPFIIYHIFLAV